MDLFAMVPLMTTDTRCWVARHTILSMVYNLGKSVQKGWRKLRGFKMLAKVVRGMQFKNGDRIDPLEADKLNWAVL
jgi:hypothetical protein